MRVKRGTIVRMFETKLGTEQDSGTDPVAPAEQMLGVLRFCSNALALPVVEELIA